ncbi:MAG: NAD-binding protein [Fimbriimonadaceae bacterium]
MMVVVLGCGRSGAALTLMLASRGHDVTVIERSPEALRRLGKKPECKIVVGNGLDMDVLEKAGVARCDAFLAMTRGDNTNLMAAQVVKKRFDVEKVLVKVADPVRAEAYREMGLYCVNASALIAGLCIDQLTGAPFRPIDQYNVLVEELSI